MEINKKFVSLGRDIPALLYGPSKLGGKKQDRHTGYAFG